MEPRLPALGAQSPNRWSTKEVLKIDFNFNPPLPTMSGHVPSFAQDHVRTSSGGFTLRLSKSGPHSVWVPLCMGSLQGPALNFFFLQFLMLHSFSLRRPPSGYMCFRIPQTWVHLDHKALCSKGSWWKMHDRKCSSDSLIEHLLCRDFCPWKLWRSLWREHPPQTSSLNNTDFIQYKNDFLHFFSL